MSRLQKFFPALSLAAFLAVWQVLALALDSTLLPSPLTVLGVFWLELISGQLTYHLGATLIRLIVSFTIAMLLGSAIGLALGRNKKLDAFFDNWLVIFLNIPALVMIILCYVWFGLNEASAILAVLINKLPNVVVTVREGARALDQDLLDMARCYRLSRLDTLRHVIWPQLHPFLMSATRSGLALIWKIILIVELLGRNNGVGFQLHLYFQLFDVASILAYSIAFVIVIQGIEHTILKPLDKKSQRWRR
ncbi:ABC transporter permease [Candidatus Methylomicrobium oryzae]|uniref:ABC transporter permease n=1 Tax=Candidatus Methylomicrobium oryzae TaxID=2802053 RepID=UPI00192173A8|nr:ABC transporter permease [Methylomicrobium sp. RS1]MBL1264906.1 ABC transporter permease [Methylomicrobium sp. RS1]